MNTSIVSLVDRLESADAESREDAVLFLGMLLEKEFSRCPDREFYRTVLSAEFLDLKLNAAAKARLLETLGERLFQEAIPMTVRTVLLVVLGKCCCLKDFPQMLRFLKRYADFLDDESAYNVVVALTPSHFAPDQREEVRRQLVHYETLDTLEKLTLRRSARLDGPLNSLILSVQGILRV